VPATGLCSTDTMVRTMKNIKHHISHLLSDHSGNFAVTLALTAVPLLMLTGAGVDLGRAYYVRGHVSEALDAATLAVASSSDTSTDALKTRFETMFAANYHLTTMAPYTEPTMTIKDNLVSSTVSVTLPMTVMSTVMPTLTITVKSEVNKQTSGVELVMALDTTGSMSSNNKIVELKAAAHNLITTIFGSETTSTGATVGIVPFTDTVNIGSHNTTYISDPSVYDWGKDSSGHALGWGGCVMAPNSTHDQDDAFTSTNGKWLPYYWPSSSSNLWSTASKSTTPSNSPCKKKSDPRCVYPTVTTYNINSSQGPNEGCVGQAITPLTNNRITLDNAIDALTPNGSTHINVGMAWAWYTISPSFPFSEGQAYDSPKVKKYVVLMTDGENTFQTFSAYGNLSDGKLGTTNQTTAISTLDSRLTTICNNMKAQGITIFTVALEVTSQTSKDILSNCATPPGRYFTATSSDLKSVFSSIGGQISKVRLAK